jgi:hypothetical protein
MTPFYLSFQDEAEANSVLFTTIVDEQGEVVSTTSNYQNINYLGVVYEPAPIPTPDDYVPVPYPAPNFGANVLVLDGEDSAPIEPYAVQPSPYPQRVWAI